MPPLSSVSSCPCSARASATQSASAASVLPICISFGYKIEGPAFAPLMLHIGHMVCCMLFSIYIVTSLSECWPLFGNHPSTPPPPRALPVTRMMYITGLGSNACAQDSICHSSATSQKEQWAADRRAARCCLCPSGLEGTPWHIPGHHSSTRHGHLVSQGNIAYQITPGLLL